MIVILLIISLILHLITFYWLIISIQRINQLKQTHPETIKEEIDNSLSAYLLDMKEDNQQLLAYLQPLIDQQSKQNNANSIDRMGHVNMVSDLELEKVQQESNSDESKQLSSNEPSQQFSQTQLADQNNLQQSITDEKESIAPSLQVQVAELLKKGYNENEIAKKLNRGKGEIQLLLKFNQKR